MLLDSSTLSELLGLHPAALDLGFDSLSKKYRALTPAGIQVYPEQWNQLSNKINETDPALDPYQNVLTYLKKYTSIDGCDLQNIFNVCEGLIARLSTTPAADPLIEGELARPYSLRKIKRGTGNVLTLKPLYLEALKKAHPYTVGVFLKTCLVHSKDAVLEYSQRESLIEAGAQNHIEAWDPSFYRVTTLLGNSVREYGLVNSDLENKKLSWTELLNIAEQFNQALLPLPTHSPRRKFSLTAS